MTTAGKQTFIRDLAPGIQVADLFLISGMNLAETKAGKPYLALTIMDSSGEIQARVWENAERFAPLVQPGKIVHLRGVAQSFRDVLQLKVDHITAVNNQAGLDLGDFMPATTYDVDAMAAELLKIIRSIGDDLLRTVVLKIFGNADFFARFCRAPAAKKMHHAYLGGLLEHTLSVTRLALKVVDHYPGVDRDLLVAGAALHDVGKVKEFQFETLPYDYTDSGRLVGHLVLGAEMVRCAAEDEKGDSLRLDQLVHLILSHHGRYEYGSPCLPMTLEAMLLNFIDDMDSKVNYIDNLSKNLDEPGYQWSAYQRPLERFLFLRRPEDEARHTPPETVPAAETEGQNRQVPLQTTKQQTLF